VAHTRHLLRAASIVEGPAFASTARLGITREELDRWWAAWRAAHPS
jgi:hypothetical protein